MTVTFDLQELLNDPHREIFTSESRYRVVVAGRRFGKSFMSVYLLLYNALKRDDQNLLYIAPTYRQAREIVWNILKDKTPSSVIKSINETRLDITFINGSTIGLRGADAPDSLRGLGLDGCIFDEFQDVKPEAWTNVIRPALADRKGFALFIGTPKGYNHLYDLYQKGYEATDWQSWQYTTLQGGYVPDEEIEAAKSDMDEKTFKQEFLASFENYEGRVAAYFNRDTHLTYENVQPKDILHIGIDLNVGVMPAAVHVFRGEVLVCVDELFGALDTPTLIKQIKDRYPDNLIYVYPDASSGARKTVGADQTDLTMLRKAFRVRARKANPRIADRVNAFNSMCLSADGVIRYKVSKRCKRVIESLDRHIYDERTGLPDKKAGHDHMYDALSYCTYWHSPLTKASIETITYTL